MLFILRPLLSPVLCFGGLGKRHGRYLLQSRLQVSRNQSGDLVKLNLYASRRRGRRRSPGKVQTASLPCKNLLYVKLTPPGIGSTSKVLRSMAAVSWTERCDKVVQIIPAKRIVLERNARIPKVVHPHAISRGWRSRPTAARLLIARLILVGGGDNADGREMSDFAEGSGRAPALNDRAPALRRGAPALSGVTAAPRDVITAPRRSAPAPSGVTGAPRRSAPASSGVTPAHSGRVSCASGVLLSVDARMNDADGPCPDAETRWGSQGRRTPPYLLPAPR